MKRKYVKLPKIVKNDVILGKILNITQKIDRVKSGSIYVCPKGLNYNTAPFVKEAIKRGAKYVFGSYNFNFNGYFKVKSPRKTLAYLLNIFYGYPDKKLKIVAVLGTNGKTSTTYIFKDLFKSLGKRCGVIGTNGIYIDEDYFESSLTTPDSEELFFYLDKMKQQNIEYVIMEVSAHSVYFDKVFSINFSRAIFTNFSQDHLDFFKTMDAYKKTKLSFFKNYNIEKCMVNADDNVCMEVCNYSLVTSYGYGGDIKIVDASYYQDKTLIKILYQKNYEFFIPFITDYNVYNYMAVFALALSYNFNINEVIEKSKNLKKLSGRFEVINFKKTHTIIIDYAHTPKSTSKTLQMVKKYYPYSYVITLFGSPGNREQQKRSITGRIVSRYSDMCIITSDNPDYENPIKIISQIKKGVKCKHLVFEDRQLAVKRAMEIFFKTPDCVLVILGKGIEKYQVINGVKIPYNDKTEVEKYM